METNAKLYSLGYSETRTWMAALLFVACNMVLPQVFHLIPQGGIVFAPLSLVILVGAYKLGWKPALLAAVASPLVNHLVFGQPAWAILPAMTAKLAVLALVAGWVAERLQRVSVPILLAVVVGSELLGAGAEWVLTGGLATTMADFTLGWPGLLLQVFGGYGLLKLGAR